MKDRTLELLNKYLDSDYIVLPMAPSRTTRQDVNNIEEKLGIQFPEEYKIHLIGEEYEQLKSRGIYVEVKEGIWPRPKPLDVGPFWSFLYGFHTYTASRESEDWMRLEVVGTDFLRSTGIHAIPILKIIGDADLYCVNERSEIVLYRHEENTVETVNKTFWELLEFELNELRERKEAKVQENSA